MLGNGQWVFDGGKKVCLWNLCENVCVSLRNATKKIRVGKYEESSSREDMRKYIYVELIKK